MNPTLPFSKLDRKRGRTFDTFLLASGLCSGQSSRHSLRMSCYSPKKEEGKYLALNPDYTLLLGIGKTLVLVHLLSCRSLGIERT